MTAATLSRLPLVAGGTLLGSLGRGAFWAAARAMDFGFWGVAQFMRAPVAVSTVAIVVGLSALAGANALYFQHERHPAPLFFSPPRAEAAPARLVPVAPVLPKPRPKLEPVALDSGVTGSIPHDAPRPITAADIKALQAKLIAMKLLTGDADGIYGPRTAFAIRGFESRVGMHADGKVTPALLAAVQNATVPLPDAVPTTAATAEPTPPAAIPAKPVQPVPLAPLPATAMTVAPVASAPKPAAAPQPAAVAAAAPQPAAPADTFAANSLPASSPPPAATLPAAVAGAEPIGQGTADPASLASARLTAAQRLAAQFGTLPPAATAAEAIPDVGVGDDSQGSTDPALITKIQKGLASLGFLADRIDGVPGEGTAKAIRNFQVFYNYKVTGLATHQLLRLLVQHGATI